MTGLVGRESPSEPARKPRQDWAQGKSRVAGVLGYGDSKETEALRGAARSEVKELQRVYSLQFCGTHVLRISWYPF